jgi:HlyD family secretion protein
MKPWFKPLVFLTVLALLVVAWMVYFHNVAVAGVLPKWAWLQSGVAWLGERKAPEAAEDEDPDNTKNDIPVHTARAEIRTLHRYVDGFGTVMPQPARKDQPAGGANLSSPVAATVAKVVCQVGQAVKPGEPLIQLEDRVARAAEEQAAAALKQAQASLDAFQTSLPQQLRIAELNVEKSQAAVEFAQRTHERLKTLAASQGVTGKTVEQAAVDLAAARVDLATNQKQLTLLKPQSIELQQEQAKVAQATAALKSATTQRELLTLTSPIAGTVVAVNANPGDAVDATRILVQVVALDHLVVDVDVPAEMLPAKAEGLAVQIFAVPPPPTDFVRPASVPPHEPVMGTLAFVSPQVDVKTGAAMVVISLPADSGLKPGVPVRVRIIVEEHKDVVAVPREAVVADENGDPVISIVEGNQATHKVVHAGIEENAWIEINDDSVRDGTQVVTAGAFGLPAASRVKVLE